MKAAKNRDDFNDGTRELLAKRAGYMCAYPGCRRLTVGPSDDRASGVSVTGVAAHITAASDTGPRYDKSLSSPERSSERNGVWLCQTHGKLIDDNESVHTVAEIRRWKKQHEEWVFARVANADNAIQDGISRIELIGLGPFEDRVVIKLGRHNLVFGKNESGKSTLCQAIATFSGGVNFQWFTDRLATVHLSQRSPTVEATISISHAVTRIALSHQKIKLPKSRSKSKNRIHILVNYNIASSWPTDLIHAIYLGEDTFRSKEGPADRFSHIIWYLARQLNQPEAVLWDMLRDEIFQQSSFGYRFRRTGLRKVDVLVPDGREFYLPFGNLGGGEGVFVLFEILLKVMRSQVASTNWVLLIDSAIFLRLDDAGKQQLFDYLTGITDFNLQTIFCVNYEAEGDHLKQSNDDKWIGASVAGNLTVHAFL